MPRKTTLLLIFSALMFHLLPLSAWRVTPLERQGQLPVAAVRCVMQDSEGFMWYGTVRGGVCRDDGYRIRTFLPEMMTPAPSGSNTINAILEDSLHRLWLATEEGVYVLSADRGSLQRIEGLEGRWAFMTADSTGHVWAVGEESGVVQVTMAEPHRLRQFPLLKGEASHMLCDHRGRLWLSTQTKGLMLWDDKSAAFQSVGCQTQRGLGVMAADRHTNGLWVAVWGHGILHFDPVTAVCQPQQTTAPSPQAGCIIDLVVDERQGLLWASTMADLIAYGMQGNALLPFDASGFLPPQPRIVDHLCLDRQGNLWVAGFSPGTFVVSPQDEDVERITLPAMRSATGFDLLADRAVRDADGGWWIWQGRHGLMHFDVATGKLVSAAKSFSREICRDAKGAGIWATADSILYHVIYKGGQCLATPVATLPADIHAIATDARADVAVSAGNAIYLVPRQGGSPRLLRRTKHAAWQLVALHDGTLFAVGEDAPLPRGHTITAAAQAVDGTLWAVSRQGGVFCQASGEPWQEAEGLEGVVQPGQPLISVATDIRGHVWLLSDQKIVEFLPETGALRVVDSRRAGVNYFYQLEPIDGLHMAVGGAGAVCLLQTAEALDLPSAGGRVRVVEALVGDSLVQWKEGETTLRVGSSATHIELHLSSLDVFHASQIAFAYSIDGGPWVHLPQGEATIRLSRLPEGTLRLALRSTDRYGRWQSEATTLEVYRRPLWWHRWWAVAIFVAVLAAAVYGLWRLNRRIRLLRLLQRRRQRLAVSSVAVVESEERQRIDDDDLLARAVLFVEKHIADPRYGVEQLSQDMCMSRMNLYRHLTRLSGLSPSAFIRDIRLKKAAATLRQHPNCSIVQLSREVGFATPSYFSRQFREKFGCLPSEYARFH